MLFREATLKDIEEMHLVRMSVKENVLSGPLVVTPADYADILTVHGKGWLCEIDNKIAGFAIVDKQQNNVWALFVQPDFEKKGIGKKLHTIMIDWYFSQTQDKLWLSTSPNTRAYTFYRMSGWTEAGKQRNGEVRFELTFEDWKRIQDV